MRLMGRTFLAGVLGSLLCGSASAGVATPRETDIGPALTDRETATHLLNRMAFGPRPGDVDRVMEMGWQAWAKQQLDPSSIDNSQVEQDVLSLYPSLGLTLSETFGQYLPEGDGNDLEVQRKRNELRGDLRDELRNAVLHRAIYSNRQFEEVILEFWRNHLNIDGAEDEIIYLAPNYESQVLRRFAFDKFENLLLASATHPAMLIYLDNVVSQKPLTDREQRLVDRFEGRGRKPSIVSSLDRQNGLNENYARELMELHTLGVDRRYRQQDVTELARVLTGWTARWNENGEYGFYFNPEVHDENDKWLFGTRLRGGGFDQGVAVIRGLARHDLTADFISRKLCRYLLRDEPSEQLVSKVARVFSRTNGDLPKVYEAIIFSDDFLYRQNHRVKFKTPFEFVVSALRATGAQVDSYNSILYQLARMGQPVYNCEDPTGFYDQAEAWLDPGVLVYRWVFALQLGRNDLEGVRVPDHRQANVTMDNLEAKLIAPLLAGDVSPQLTEQVREAFVHGGAPEATAVLLGSPDFQQQ